MLERRRPPNNLLDRCSCLLNGRGYSPRWRLLELVAHMVCMRGTEKFPESISKLGSTWEESVSIQVFLCIDTEATRSEQIVWVSIQGFTCIDTDRLKKPVNGVSRAL
jgi:hypothetical protein